MRRPRRHFFVPILAVLLTAGGPGIGDVRANGRFPEALKLIEHPGNPNRLFLTATYGLLATEDRGRNWYTICEQSFALKFLEGNPLLEVLPDGSLMGAIYDTLNRSTDCGCSWQTTFAASVPETVMDITVDRTTGAILALAQDATTFPAGSAVHESTDGGKTWRKLSDLPTDIVGPLTIDVAPSDSSRVYVSGTRTFGAQNPVALLASTDHGASWQARDLVGANVGAAPFIAAVHPTNPERIFVRTDEWDDSGEYAANDALYYSDDGGRSWREVIRRPAKLFGFALSPDGATVLVGYGDPQDAGGRTTNSEEYGIYKASTSTLAFERIFVGTVSCLAWTQTGVYACLVENHPEVPTPGMSLGFAPNADFTVATPAPLTSLLGVKTVRGPLGCTASLCLGNWTTGMEGVAPLCDVLQATCGITPANTGLSCAAAPDAGASGQAGGSGMGGTGGSGGGGLPPGGQDGGGRSGSGGNGVGCGCMTAEAGSVENICVALVLLLMSWCAARRARGRS